MEPVAPEIGWGVRSRRPASGAVLREDGAWLQDTLLIYVCTRVQLNMVLICQDPNDDIDDIKQARCHVTAHSSEKGPELRAVLCREAPAQKEHEKP